MGCVTPEQRCRLIGHRAMPIKCISYAAAAIALCGLNGCSTAKTILNEPRSTLYAIGAPIPKGGGRRVIGKPHFANGSWYYPAPDPTYDRIGHATWYGEDFRGRTTANGEIFDPQRLTTAHPTLPLPSYLRITNLENGRALILRANDRGPFIDGRLVDISERAANLLGIREAGIVRSRVQYLGPAPLNGDDTLEERAATALFASARSH